MMMKPKREALIKIKLNGKKKLRSKSNNTCIHILYDMRLCNTGNTTQWHKYNERTNERTKTATVTTTTKDKLTAAFWLKQIFVRQWGMENVCNM